LDENVRLTAHQGLSTLSEKRGESHALRPDVGGLGYIGHRQSRMGWAEGPTA